MAEDSAQSAGYVVAKAGEYVIGVALNSVSAGGYSRIQIAKYQKAKA